MKNNRRAIFSFQILNSNRKEKKLYSKWYFWSKDGSNDHVEFLQRFDFFQKKNDKKSQQFLFMDHNKKKWFLSKKMYFFMINFVVVVVKNDYIMMIWMKIENIENFEQQQQKKKSKSKRNAIIIIIKLPWNFVLIFFTMFQKKTYFF